jgi:large subunit ribosomal protein L4
MNATMYSTKGTKLDKTAALDKTVFGLELNHELVGLAYRTYLANGRTAGAKTLTRGEASGGGKKPWRQKGTGRARVGSIRVPNWRGGGVAFGPTGQENHSLNLPVAMKRVAIRQALSAQAKDNKIMILESFVSGEGKVKPTVELLSKLGLSGSILLVVAQKEPMLERATRNIAGLKLVAARYLNVFDVLNADVMVIAEPALAPLSEWLGTKPTRIAATKAAKTEVKS